MKTCKSYHAYLIESLKNQEEAATDLAVVSEDGSLERILLALKNIAEAQRA